MHIVTSSNIPHCCGLVSSVWLWDVSDVAFSVQKDDSYMGRGRVGLWYCDFVAVQQKLTRTDLAKMPNLRPSLLAACNTHSASASWLWSSTNVVLFLWSSVSAKRDSSAATLLLPNFQVHRHLQELMPAARSPLHEVYIISTQRTMEVYETSHCRVSAC